MLSMNFMVRRSLTGLFNPVLSDPNFREIELSRRSFLASRPDFAFRITNFEFQVREIPDPDKLLGTTDKAHQKYKNSYPGNSHMRGAGMLVGNFE